MAAIDAIRRTEAAGQGAEPFRIRQIAFALLQATPLHVLLCAMLYILSQLCMLAAILLPWKLLTIMATDGLPGVTPEFLHGYPDRELVVILGVCACVAFVLYALAEMSIGLVCRHGSALVLGRHQKIGLFGGHRQRAGALYRGFLRSVAAVVAIVAIAACLALLYPALLLALSTYLGTGLAYVYWRKGRAPSASAAALAPELKSNAWWGIGFLYGVAWVVVDYWRGAVPDLTTTFASLLLLRQSVVLAGMAYRTYASFVRQRSKAGALFLRDAPWNPEPGTDAAFLALAEPERRQEWVRDLLRLHHGGEGDLLVTECRVTDSSRLVSITVRCEAGGRSRAFLLKLFHSTREEGAQHEKEILETAPDWWPAPALLATHKVEGYSCLVFDWRERAHWMTAGERSGCLPNIRETLLSCGLADTLVARYERSRPHLANRLNAVDWDYLDSVTPQRSAIDGTELRRHWAAIAALARSLPRQVVIPRLHMHRICRAEGRGLICNWTRWLWEPAGSGWPVRTDLAQFEEALSRASARRPELARVAAPEARLMAVLYEFERLWRARDHAGAVKLIPTMAQAARETGLVKVTSLSGASPAGHERSLAK